MSFYLGTLNILEDHNFLCRSSIEVEALKKVVALVESFPTICGTPLACMYFKAIHNF
jgi:hypothetical protein